MADVETGQSAERAGQPPRLAFISHKHRDRDLAELVSNFLEDLSNGEVRLFVSSAVAHEGPRFGVSLSDSLRDALARSGLVILIYTDPTDNWEWCLWECGVATDPRDPTPTHVEVFTSAADKYELAPGQDELRVPLTWTDGNGVTVTKTYVFHRSLFAISVEYSISNQSPAPWLVHSYARIVRTQTLSLRTTEFILAERSLGAGSWRVLFVHMLPNVIGPLLILVSMDVPVVITIEAGLSFLGLGVRPPTASWGSILNDGYSFIRNTPWMVIARVPCSVKTMKPFSFRYHL